MSQKRVARTCYKYNAAILPWVGAAHPVNRYGYPYRTRKNNWRNAQPCFLFKVFGLEGNLSFSTQ